MGRPPRWRERERTVALGVFATAAAVTAGVASCSLGLDETLIDAGSDAAFGSDVATGDGETILPGGDGGTSDGGGPIACTSDAPCTSTNACLKGHCDLGRHVCVFDVCRAACAAGSCVANACGPEAPYKLKVAQIALGGSVSLHGAVAVYPWLFAILPDGLVAFDVANPADGSPPPQRQVTGLPFKPTQITASGNRVWMTGPVQAQSGSVPIAYIDVPTDPSSAQPVEAQGATATIENGTLGSFFLLPAASATGGALLAGAGATFPTALVNAPFANPTKLTPIGIPAAPGDVLQGVASGGRILLGSQAPNGIVSFHLIEAPGTANAKSDDVVQMTATGAVSNGAVGSGNEGAIVWASANNVPNPPAANIVTAAHAGFLVDSEKTAIAAAPPGVDFEAYGGETADIPIGTPVIGPVALLDANTAVVTALAHEDPGFTSVQFLRRNPVGLVKEADNVTVRRALLPVAVSTVVAVTASDGIAYVIANAAIAPNAATAYVFDPACAP